MSKVFFSRENEKVFKKNDLNEQILKYLKPMMQLVRDGITYEKKYMKEPLICLSMLCKSLRNLMYEHVLSLIGLLIFIKYRIHFE
jgi:hypothetical protein